MSRGRARRDRRRRWPRSGTTWACSAAHTGVRRDDGRQGRRLRPRHAARGPGRPRGRRRPGSASPPSTRRSRCGRPATPAGSCAGSACPGEDYAAAIAADVDVTAYTAAELARSRRPSADGTGRPGVQLKVDTGLSRGGAPAPTGPTCSPPPAGQERAARSGSPGSGPTSPAATSPTTPPTTPRRRAFERRARPGRGGRARARGAPPRQLRGRDPAPERPLRPGPVRHRVVRPRPRARPHPRPRRWIGPAMTAARLRPARAGQADRRRRRRLLRPHLARRAADHASGLVPVGYGDGVPRHAGNRAEVLVGERRRPVRGRVCMDQFVVDLGDDRTAAGDRVVLFGTGLTASRPPRTGPSGATRSATRSSPGSAAGSTRRYVDESDREEPADERPGQGRRARRVRGRRRRRGHRRRGRPPPPGHRPPRRGRRRRPSARCGRPPSRSSPTTAYPLHVEVDRVRARSPLTVVFVHGYALNLDCWHFQRAGYRGLVRTVYYDQRSPRPLRPVDGGSRHHRPARPRPAAGPRRGRPGRPGRARRPLDGRDEHHRAGRAAPGAVRRPGRRGRADRRRRPAASTPPGPGPRRAVRTSAARSRCAPSPRWRAATGPSTACAGSAGPSRRSPPTRSPSATTSRPATSSSSTRCCRRRRSR